MSSKQIPLNASETQNKTIIWAGALSIAWHQLKNKIIQKDIKVKSDDDDIQEMVDNFNHCMFTQNDLSDQSYYAKAGYGNKTVNQINKQIIQKFPGKTTPPLQPNIQETSIISFAYLYKELKFQSPFSKKQVFFKNKNVKGFSAQTFQHRKQVIVHNYQNPQNFLVSLKNKSEKDELYLMKTEDLLKPHQVRNRLNSLKGQGQFLENQDIFEMPIINIDHKKGYEELNKIFLLNQGFENYYLGEVYEIIKLKIDERGAEIQNEGMIMMQQQCCVENDPRILKLDSAFWIIMRQKNQHPYLICYIRQIEGEETYKKGKKSDCSIF